MHRGYFLGDDSVLQELNLMSENAAQPGRSRDGHGDDSGELWRSHAFRQNVIIKLDEAIRQTGVLTRRSAVEMEQIMYEDSEDKVNYLGSLARLLLRIRRYGYSHHDNPVEPSLLDLDKPVVDPFPGTLRKRPRSTRTSSFPAACIMKFSLRREWMKDIPLPSLSSGSILGCNGRSREAEKYAGNYVWKIPSFRKIVIAKIDSVLQRHGNATMKVIMDMEIKIFKHSESYVMYLGYMEQLLKLLQDGSRVWNEDMAEFGEYGTPVVEAIRILKKQGALLYFSPPCATLTNWRSSRQITVGG